MMHAGTCKVRHRGLGAEGETKSEMWGGRSWEGKATGRHGCRVRMPYVQPEAKGAEALGKPRTIAPRRGTPIDIWGHDFFHVRWDSPKAGRG